MDYCEDEFGYTWNGMMFPPVLEAGQCGDGRREPRPGSHGVKSFAVS